MGRCKAAKAGTGSPWAIPFLFLASLVIAFQATSLAPLAQDSAALDLPAVSVQGKKEEKPAVEVKAEFMRKVPSSMNDPIRAMAFTPGVTVQNDLNVRPYVRGGDAGQTGVARNGLALMQPYHVGGTFSTFNLNTLESVELYRDDFPAEYPGALSGVLRLKTKKPSLDKVKAQANLSMLRGDVFVEAPVIRNKWSVYAAAQSFLFHETLHGLLNTASILSDDSLFRQDIRNYKNHINMPGFQDYHAGMTLSPHENLRVDYAGSFSVDRYAVVVPSQTNIISRPPATGNPIPEIPIIPKKEIGRSKKLSVDSVSDVGIGNQTHFVDAVWDITSEHVLENNFGFQSQDWDVKFKKDVKAVEPLILDHGAKYFNYRLAHTYTPSDRHEFKAGLSYDYKRQEYRAELPYVLYDVMINSNMDMLGALGGFAFGGFEIEKRDSSISNFDYLGELPSRIRFTHDGALEEQFGGAYFSHSLKAGPGRLTYGLRGEYQSTSDERFPAPRLSYAWKIDADDEIVFTSGLYTQNHLPFYQRDRNPSLKSEKAAHAGLKWTHDFSPGYRLMASGYYKRYFDLVAASLKPNNTLDLEGLLVPLPQSPLSAAEISDLQGILDTTVNFAALPDSIRQLAYATFGGLIYDYRNTGSGHGFGAELSLHYHPHSAWNGWISADFSLSNRQDAKGQAHYPYQYHRPVIVNWVNYFDMPGHYDIGFTYRWAMGQPYTPYSGNLDAKGSADPITVGSRNSGRLAPYSRLDMRLTRTMVRWNTRFKGYIEIWNALNNPNYFARDNSTGELKSAQLNWPFPLFFLGITAEL